MSRAERHGWKPGGYAVLDVESFDIGAWTPDPMGKAPATQVHLEMKVQGMNTPLVLRFKGPGTLNLLMSQLAEYGGEIWPDQVRWRSEG